MDREDICITYFWILFPTYRKYVCDQEISNSSLSVAGLTLCVAPVSFDRRFVGVDMLILQIDVSDHDHINLD